MPIRQAIAEMFTPGRHAASTAASRPEWVEAAQPDQAPWARDVGDEVYFEPGLQLDHAFLVRTPDPRSGSPANRVACCANTRAITHRSRRLFKLAQDGIVTPG